MCHITVTICTQIDSFPLLIAIIMNKFIFVYFVILLNTVCHSQIHSNGHGDYSSHNTNEFADRYDQVPINQQRVGSKTTTFKETIQTPGGSVTKVTKTQQQSGYDSYKRKKRSFVIDFLTNYREISI